MTTDVRAPQRGTGYPLAPAASSDQDWYHREQRRLPGHAWSQAERAHDPLVRGDGRAQS